MSDTPYIVGEVLTTFFENPQNFYKVMLVRVIESDCVDVDDEIVVTGIFGQIHWISPIVLMGRLFLIQNTENNSKQIIINRRNQLVKEGSFNIYRALIFQELGRRRLRKLSRSWARMLWSVS